ncbi:hypothetical protein Mkiyose1665_47430 [Mycobacterium kiyosense]|nr:hypothetical protein SRL2020226_10630 [Mycobacterium kiyosense]GLC10105.1 hypothetical protein SRL2020411_47510 [Mycobacterium kiyosense]GLD20140.1 hypothetical protein Mkiyose1385_42390 [Mycobacterium kiyosense]GLD37195.1 hypothetical protein Mkiyose1595_34150 [Mycobacterium kiyosense]GLD44243.1 hypothetical protein Mkiyose1665_47430 [Mycobacterium kiyosense]
MPYWQNYWQYWTPASATPQPPRPPRQRAPRPAPVPSVRPHPTPPAPHPAPPAPPAPTESRWIGKLLAVAGVAVTLIGVVLLLVLAAKAGLLRPEIRVAGGGALSAGLVAVATRLRGRPGGHVGAIALAATGIAAAYLDVIAVVTIYEWIPAPFGLALAAAVGGAGLALARRWDSEHLALLVLVPLIGLAPALTHGVDLLLVSFMLALSAAALPVQLGKDWIWMHAARIAAPTLPLLFALIAISDHDNAWLLGGACGVAAILSIAGGLILLPTTTDKGALALLTVAGTVPILVSAIGVNHALAAALSAALAAAMLAVALVGKHPRTVARIWSSWSATSALVALTVAFDGYVEGPLLLALAIVVAFAGRRDIVARWAAAGFGVVGTGLFIRYAPLHALVRATTVPTSVAVSTLAASLLIIALAVVVTRTWTGVAKQNPDLVRFWFAAAGALVTYAVTAFTVTTGVLIAGTGGGFLAGQMAATIIWIGVAAALFVYALRVAGQERHQAITAGLALTAAATAKLFLFDLATLDGIFRVAAFIVVGLVLLGMGAGYARSLASGDQRS